VTGTNVIDVAAEAVVAKLAVVEVAAICALEDDRA
jgi:hypothetical protein